MVESGVIKFYLQKLCKLHRLFLQQFPFVFCCISFISQYSKINLDISSAQATDSGWGLNISTNLIQKSGKTVCVQFGCTRPNGQDMIPNAYSICNIPSGFRPNMTAGYFVGFLYKSGDPNQRKAVSFEIRHDGYLKTGYGIDTTGYDSMLLACTYFTQ